MIDKNFIDNMNTFPMIVVGDACRDFYKYYDGPIVQIEGDRDSERDNSLREIISYYSCIPDLGRPLVISDISFINNANSILLKFLEDTTLDVILLSRFDKLNPVICSRVKHIEKYFKEKTDCKFLSIPLAQNYIDALPSDTSKFNLVKTQSKYCPKLWQIDVIFNSKSIKERYMKIVGGNEDGSQ